jgi:hypothetical protein
MKEKFNLSLNSLWLTITTAALILPVFLPSSANPEYFFGNVIGLVTTIMFILSFPACLLGIPLMFLAELVLGVNPNTIGGMYLHLFLFCLLGYVQWFWLVPRFLGNKPHLQILNLLGIKTGLPLSEAKITDISFPDDDGKTPIERVLQEKDSE